MKYKNMQPFIPKAGDSIKDQINDNGLNVKLKSLYNGRKAEWMLKYGTTKFSPHHKNSVLVQVWDSFKVYARNIIRDRFVKKTHPPSDLPNLQQITRHVMPSSKYLLDTKMKNKQYITPHSWNY